MSVLISGSIAYDNILSFPGRFGEHILAESLDHINLTFLVSSMVKNYGGCAANIAYSLKMLGGSPIVIGALGRDGGDYLKRFDDLGIETSICRLDSTFSAQSFVITDQTGSQIAAFSQGAMEQAQKAPFPDHRPIELALLGPDGLAAMVERRRQLTERHIPFIYDIGQSASQFDGEEIRRFIEAASCIAASRYEMELITQKTRYKTADITAMGKSLVVTDGERGSTVHTPAGELTVPAVPVHAVDPVGAGDAFRGGILYGLVHKFDWETTLRLGSVMASFKVENQGAQNYSATQAQIRARFESAYGQSVNL